MHFAWHSLRSFRQSWFMRGMAVALLALLTACGFSMRGTSPIPFDTLYLGMSPNTKFTTDVQRALRAASPNTKLVQSPKEAQAILQQVEDRRTIRDVSLNAQGRVEEYELGLVFTFRLINAQGRALIPDTTLFVSHEIPYDDQVIQAKQKQIENMYRSMQQTLIERLVRRLTAPEVHKTFESLRTTAPDTDDAPLFNPLEGLPGSTPPSWQEPGLPDYAR
jgi:LPS-assembly lipoprotein